MQLSTSQLGTNAAQPINGAIWVRIEGINEFDLTSTATYLLKYASI